MSTDLLIINGPGVIARRGDAVLWAESTDLRREGLLAAVTGRMRALAAGEESAPDFATWLIAELAGPRGGTIPALAFSVPDAGDVVTVVHGWGRVSGPGGMVSAPGTSHRIPATLPIAVGRADLAVVATGDSLLDLESGVVPGGAALILARTDVDAAAGGAPRHAAGPEAPPPAVAEPAPSPAFSTAPSLERAAEPAGPPEPAPEPTWPAPMAEAPSAPAAGPEPVAAPEAPGHDSMLVSLRPEALASDQAWEPLPIAQPATAPMPDDAPPSPEPPLAAPGPRGAIVPGVRCSRQHFNNPTALYCRVCGISMLQQTHVQVQGERPPLGVLVCDDGATFGLDGDYAIGCDPRTEPGVISGLAQPLIMGDAATGMAPTHVIIHLDGWEVLALNRSPGLPAAVLHRGDTQWTPLPPGQWARLAPGSYVGFAGRHVVFESNNRA